LLDFIKNLGNYQIIKIVKNKSKKYGGREK